MVDWVLVGYQDVWPAEGSPLPGSSLFPYFFPSVDQVLLSSRYVGLNGTAPAIDWWPVAEFQSINELPSTGLKHVFYVLYTWALQHKHGLNLQIWNQTSNELFHGLPSGPSGSRPASNEPSKSLGSHHATTRDSSQAVRQFESSTSPALIEKMSGIPVAHRGRWVEPGTSGDLTYSTMGDGEKARFGSNSWTNLNPCFEVPKQIDTGKDFLD